MKQYDNDFDDGVYYTVENLFGCLDPNEVGEDEFLLNKLKWLLNNGANPNYHRCNNTPLDSIQDHSSNNDYQQSPWFMWAEISADIPNRGNGVEESMWAQICADIPNRDSA